MPAELREHLRYPEDLFRVQTDVYSKYQLDAGPVLPAPGRVVGGPGAEHQPARDRRARPAPGDRARTTRRAPPTSRPRRRRAASRRTTRCSTTPPGTGEDFVILRPFVPFSSDDQRTELQAYMTASSDPDTYGQPHRVRRSTDPPDGPRTVANLDRLRAVDRDDDHPADRRRQPGALRRPADRARRRRPAVGAPVLRRGRPGQRRHVRAPASTEYRFVIVSYNDRAALGESLGEALAKLFPGYEGDLGDRAAAGDGSTPEEPDTAEPGAGTPEEVLARADELLREAEDALEDGDLGEYQAKVDEAAALIDQALSALQPTTTVPRVSRPPTRPRPRRPPRCGRLTRASESTSERTGETAPPSESSSERTMWRGASEAGRDVVPPATSASRPAAADRVAVTQVRRDDLHADGEAGGACDRPAARPTGSPRTPNSPVHQTTATYGSRRRRPRACG